MFPPNEVPAHAFIPENATNNQIIKAHDDFISFLKRLRKNCKDPKLEEALREAILERSEAIAKVS